MPEKLIDRKTARIILRKSLAHITDVPAEVDIEEFCFGFFNDYYYPSFITALKLNIKTFDPKRRLLIDLTPEVAQKWVFGKECVDYMLENVYPPPF